MKMTAADEAHGVGFVEYLDWKAKMYHYPDCWDTTAYPTILHVLDEVGDELFSVCAVCGRPFGEGILDD